MHLCLSAYPGKYIQSVRSDSLNAIPKRNAWPSPKYPSMGIIKEVNMERVITGTPCGRPWGDFRSGSKGT